MTKFTVLMPVYHGDRPDLFNSALNSIFTNTVTPDEIVLVVDGPLTSELNLIIDKYSSSTLKVIRLLSNEGITNALNLGLEYCTNDLVARCDADDINLPNRFFSQLEAFRINKDLIICGGQIREFSNESVLIKKVPLHNEEIRRYARTRNPFNHMTVMFRRSHIIKLGGYPDIPFREDYGLWIKAISNKLYCLNLDIILVQATTGIQMYERRGRPSHLRHELKLQKYLLQYGITNYLIFFYNMFFRGANMLMPKKLRALIYINFLRY